MGWIGWEEFLRIGMSIELNDQLSTPRTVFGAMSQNKMRTIFLASELLISTEQVFGLY